MYLDYKCSNTVQLDQHALAQQASAQGAAPAVKYSPGGPPPYGSARRMPAHGKQVTLVRESAKAGEVRHLVAKRLVDRAHLLIVAYKPGLLPSSFNATASPIRVDSPLRLVLAFPVQPARGGRMKPIIKALATISVCAILAIPAQADAQQVTLSLSGVVEYGRDDLNLFFGSPGEIVFLGGETYTMSLTVDAADLDSLHSTPRFADYSGTSVAMTGALTMNGKTLTWTTQASSSAVYLELAPEFSSPENRQALSMRSTASRQPGTGDRSIIARHQVVTFFWPLLASTDLNQEISFPEFMRNAVATSHFEATGMGVVPDLTTWFDGRATSATWTVSAVPEPGQYGMLAAGLVALALARRRPGWARRWARIGQE